MAIQLYDPGRQAYVNLTPHTQLSTADLLSLNILIELQAISHLLKEQSPNLPSASIESIRTDITSN